MDNNADWWSTPSNGGTDPQWHRVPHLDASWDPAAHSNAAPSAASPRRRSRAGWYATAVIVMAVATISVWRTAHDQQRASSYKGVSATEVTIDGFKAQAAATWSRDGQSVSLSAWANWSEDLKLVRIDSQGRRAQDRKYPLEPGQVPMPVRLEITVPVKDRYQAVRLSVAIEGAQRKPDFPVPHRTIEFHSDRTAFDAETGKTLKQSYSRL